MPLDTILHPRHACLPLVCASAASLKIPAPTCRVKVDGAMVRQDLSANVSAALAASLFGASVVATRVVVQTVPVLTLAVLRFGQGSLLLAVCLLLLSPRLLRVRRQDLPVLVLLGAVLFTVFPITFNLSLRLTEASTGALMLATMPLWSALLARMAHGESLVHRQVAGVVLTVAGIAVVLVGQGLGWHGDARSLVGDGLMLVTALAGASYNVLAQRPLARYSSLTVTTYAMLFGALLLLPAALTEGFLGVLPTLDEQSVLLVLFLGCFGGALGYFLWTSALRQLTPTQVAVYVNLNPLMATLLGSLLLAEQLTPVFGLGLLAVISGVLLVNWPIRRDESREKLAG